MNSHKKASFIMFLLLLHITFISYRLILIIANIFPAIAMPKNSTFLQMIGSVIFFVIPLLIYAIIKKLPLNKILMLKPISLKNFFIIVFLSFFMQPFLQLINALTSLFAENELTDALTSFYQAPFWQVFLAIAILPAILEEVIFRGIFIKEYEDCPFWFGVIFSGIFFGLMHLTITQLFYATIAGIILGILVKVTGSIWSSILAHFVLNGTQITISYFLVNQNPSLISENVSLILEEPSSKIVLIISCLINFALSIPFLALIIFLFIKVNKEKIAIIKQENIIKKQNQPKIFNVFFIATIILYLAYIIINIMI